MKIEERIEVNPTSYIPLKPLAQHTIRVDLQWTPANIPAAIFIIGGSSYPCRISGSSGFSTTGFITYQQADMTGGIYGLQFRSNGPCTPPNTINAQYFVYYDNNLIKSGSFNLGGCYSAGSYPYYNTTFETPLKTNYSFNISPASLCLGKGTTPGFALGNGCTNVEIDTTTEMVNLQILSGGEFASFYGYQGMITDNLTIPYSALNSVELKQDQFFSGSPATIRVQSNLSGLTKLDSIIAYPKSSYGINAETVDYPIQYGDTKYIEVTTYGPGGCSAIFPSDIKLNAVITKGSESGYLQDFDHGTTGDTLMNIAFNSFSGNHIGFISDGVKKDIADTVIVTFSTTDAEISTKQVTVIINPSPLYLAIEPENVAPGDTALIIIKSRLEDGTLIDFPEWQTFELKMIEGCALGKILTGGDTARYFYDVPQPIKFVADSLASGTVGLIVGLVEEIIGTRPVQENDADKIEEAAKEKQNKLNAEKTKKEVNENPSYNPGAEFCPIEEIQSFTTEEFDFNVVGDECDEEIVVCNNPQPQLFNPSWIELYRNGSDFDPEPSNPNSLKYKIVGCQLKRNNAVQGITFIIPGVSLLKEFNNPDYLWTSSSSAIIKLCLNEIEQRWTIEYDELRVPIFSSACIEGYTDLGDGTNTTILDLEIQNKSDYAILLKDLSYWEKGPYSQQGKKPQKYAFESGILKHEYKHFQIDSANVLNTFNKFFLDLFSNWILDQSLYPCPEDALNSKEESIRVFTSNEVSKCFLRYNNLEDWEKKKEELNCDQYARSEYEIIRNRIENWAANKSW